MNTRILILAFLMLLWAQSVVPQARMGTFLVTRTPPQEEERSISFALEEENAEKSVWLAVASSLVLPGMGELYVGSFATGKYFLIGEAGIWLTYSGFITHGNWLRNDARTFAVQHANVQLDGKDDQFEVNIGNFGNTAEYNQQKLRNREYELVYTTTQDSWQWDNDMSREQFKSLRIRSDEIYRNAKFLIGAAVVNRVISAFMAGRSAAAHNRRVRYEGAWQIRVSPSGGFLNIHGMELQLSKEF
ncbi:MAG TPA: hypothetical protein VI704_00840 [Bacteroidota bacterium]|nr:hypothetical protein [Bacteroidota bacterium]